MGPYPGFPGGKTLNTFQFEDATDAPNNAGPQ